VISVSFIRNIVRLNRSNGSSTFSNGTLVNSSVCGDEFTGPACEPDVLSAAAQAAKPVKSINDAKRKFFTIEGLLERLAWLQEFE
jgi:hypothetical protein